MKSPPNKRDAALAVTRAAGGDRVGTHDHPKYTQIDENLQQTDDPTWLTSQPWAGLFKSLIAADRYGWSHLAKHARRQIKREARRE